MGQAVELSFFTVLSILAMIHVDLKLQLCREGQLLLLA